MRIGVNARFLTKPYTGIGQHTKYLFEALASLYPDDHFVMITPEPVEITMPKNVEIIVEPENFFGTAGMRKTYWEQRQVPKILKEKQVDLAHFPYPSNPWYGFEKPVCVTVHDTIPWESELYRRSMTTRLYQDSCRFAVRKANHVFTVSEASKHDVIRLTHIEEKKISLSYNAPAPQFSTKVPPDQCAKILQKYGLNPDRRYFFYVGGYDARKNVPMIVEAFQRFIAPHYDVDLVLAGGKAVDDPLYQSFDTILHQKKSGHKGNILRTGFVEENDLPALYQSSFVFVNVSTREGCNLPLLEALTSGVPVITSDIDVHREMVGSNALFVETHDTEKLGNYMDQFIRDEQFYNNRRQDAANYRCPFSWEQTAQKVFEIYRRLAE